MRSAAKRLLLDRDTWSPYRLANNAAIYSLEGSPSDSTYLIDGSNRVMLVADRSGNSSVNGLVLPGITGNYASYTALTAFGTNDFTISAKIRVNSLSATQTVVGGATNSVVLNVNTDGTLQTSKENSASNTASSATVAAFTDYVITYTRSGTTGTYYINAVAGGTTTDARDYTVGQTTIGAGAGGANKSFNGIVYWARVYSVALDAAGVAADASGTVQANNVLNVDFSSYAKLAASPVTAATGQSITINQTAIALPARICGARDLTQAVQANQPIFSVSGGYNIATFDGSNDYLKSAAFSLSQPESVYFTGSQETWTAGDTLFDGNGVNSGHLQQDTLTPRLRAYAGASLAQISPTLGQKSIFTTIFNGASSSIRWNRNAAVTGNAGTSAMNGFTLAVTGDNTGTFANITFSEAIIRSAADDNALQLRLANYLIRKWGVTA